MDYKQEYEKYRALYEKLVQEEQTFERQPSDQPTEYPNNIKELRKRARLSQAELADLVGVKQTTVGRYERGEIRIPLEKILAITVATGSKFEELELPEVYSEVVEMMYMLTRRALR